MEIKEGMYVRLKANNVTYIRQIIEVCKDIRYATYMVDKPFCNQTGLSPKKIIKASFNIIDLIEPMDLMYIDIFPDDCDGIVAPRVAETLNELEKWKERFASGDCILKGVFTKEQIKQNIYWLGDK